MSFTSVQIPASGSGTGSVALACAASTAGTLLTATVHSGVGSTTPFTGPTGWSLAVGIGTSNSRSELWFYNPTGDGITGGNPGGITGGTWVGTSGINCRGSISEFSVGAGSIPILNDTGSNDTLPFPTTSFTVATAGTAVTGDLGISAFEASYSVAAPCTDTIPAGYTRIKNAVGSVVNSWDSFYDLSVSSGVQSVTSTRSTGTNLSGWSGVVATFTESVALTGTGGITEKKVTLAGAGISGSGGASGGLTAKKVTLAGAGTYTAPPVATLGLVQEVGSFSGTGTALSTFTITLGAPGSPASWTGSGTDGNMLSLSVRAVGGSALSQISDSQGNVWQIDQLGVSTGVKSGLASCIQSSGNHLVTGDTITVVMTAASANIRSTVTEYAGIAGVLVSGVMMPSTDTHATAHGTTSPLTVTTAGVSDTASELVLSTVANTTLSTWSIVTPDASSGDAWVDRALPAQPNYLDTAYQIAAGKSQFSAQWSSASTTGLDASIVGYRVAPLPIIKTTTFSPGQVNKAFNQGIVITNGTPPFSLSVEPGFGTPPAGLSLNTASAPSVPVGATIAGLSSPADVEAATTAWSNLVYPIQAQKVYFNQTNPPNPVGLFPTSLSQKANGIEHAVSAAALGISVFLCVQPTYSGTTADPGGWAGGANKPAMGDANTLGTILGDSAAMIAMIKGLRNDGLIIPWVVFWQEINDTAKHGGTGNQYTYMYSQHYPRLKAAFPDLQVGVTYTGYNEPYATADQLTNFAMCPTTLRPNDDCNIDFITIDRYAGGYNKLDANNLPIAQSGGDYPYKGGPGGSFTGTPRAADMADYANTPAHPVAFGWTEFGNTVLTPDPGQAALAFFLTNDPAQLPYPGDPVNSIAATYAYRINHNPPLPCIPPMWYQNAGNTGGADLILNPGDYRIGLMQTLAAVCAGSGGAQTFSLVGKPTTAGSYPFTLQVTDAQGAKDTQAYTLVITGAISGTGGITEQKVSLSATAIGGTFGTTGSGGITEKKVVLNGAGASGTPSVTAAGGLILNKVVFGATGLVGVSITGTGHFTTKKIVLAVNSLTPSSVSGTVAFSPHHVFLKLSGNVTVQTFPIFTLLPRTPRWQYFAQRALTGEWLDRSGLPISGATITWDLVTDQISGTINPEYLKLIASDGLPLLDEWNTFIYAEEEGQIRWGGIFTNSDFTGSGWSLSGIGMRGFANGYIFDGLYSETGIYNPHPDPLDVVRFLWNWIQSQDDSNLNLVVDTTKSPVSIGVDSSSSSAYQLAWWNDTDIGQELSNLASAAPFDMSELHTWDSTRDNVNHRLILGYPRIGTRQSKLRFAEGENLTALLDVTRNGTSYANRAIGHGAGNGSKTIRVKQATRDGRLARYVTITDQTIDTKAKMSPIVARTLNSVNGLLGGTVNSCNFVDHPNAPMGSFGVGDDILIQVRAGWLAGQQIWHRITSLAYNPDTRSGTLSMARTDSFSYISTLDSFSG